jgi:hypothetical protein
MQKAADCLAACVPAPWLPQQASKEDAPSPNRSYLTPAVLLTIALGAMIILPKMIVKGTAGVNYDLFGEGSIILACMLPYGGVTATMHGVGNRIVQARCMHDASALPIRREA